MGDRTGARRGGPALLLVGITLICTAMVGAWILVGAGDADGPDPVVATAPPVRPTEPVTTTTSSSPPPTGTAAPPTTEPVDDSGAVALEFLAAVADEEVVRECRASEYIVRRDHPAAQIRVAVIGDSLTVQTVAMLVSDARFDWTVVSVCGARVDHFAGGALFESSYDLTAGLDVALADVPDILVFALGTNDALRETFESRAVEHGPSLAGILDRTAAVRCRAWVDVHTFTPGTGGPYERWAYYATRFNQALAAQVESAGVPLLRWSSAVEANDPLRLLSPDGVHLTSEGRAARVRLIAEALTGLANDCVLAPPPTEPPPPPPPVVSTTLPPTTTSTVRRVGR